MEKTPGSRVWYFPDGELPEPGNFKAKGHESVIILNTTDEPADCRLTLYFTDREPEEISDIQVAARRVRCIRTNSPEDLHGYRIPCGIQYAMRWESSVPVIMMYGRLDTTDQPMHFYINQGFSEPTHE